MNKNGRQSSDVDCAVLSVHYFQAVTELCLSVISVHYFQTVTELCLSVISVHYFQAVAELCLSVHNFRSSSPAHLPKLSLTGVCTCRFSQPKGIPSGTKVLMFVDPILFVL